MDLKSIHPNGFFYYIDGENMKNDKYYRRIRDLREDSDKKQLEIAMKLKTTQQQYYRYETGIREIPVRHLIELAKLYETSIDYIVGLTDDKRPYKRK